MCYDGEDDMMYIFDDGESEERMKDALMASLNRTTSKDRRVSAVLKGVLDLLTKVRGCIRLGNTKLNYIDIGNIQSGTMNTLYT